MHKHRDEQKYNNVSHVTPHKGTAPTSVGTVQVKGILGGQSGECQTFCLLDGCVVACRDHASKV